VAVILRYISSIIIIKLNICFMSVLEEVLFNYHHSTYGLVLISTALLHISFFHLTNTYNNFIAIRFTNLVTRPTNFLPRKTQPFFKGGSDQGSCSFYRGYVTGIVKDASKTSHSFLKIYVVSNSPCSERGIVLRHLRCL